jgi:hypothetical protein
VNRQSTLIFSGADHRRLTDHLFPGDGKEAAAVVACTRVPGRQLKLLAKEIGLVPYEACTRTSVRLTWPADILDAWQDRAEAEGLSLMLVHSHPTGYFDFSSLDNEADQLVMPYLYPYGTTDTNPLWHGSAVMMPNGALRGRLYDRTHRPHPIDLIAVYGDELRFFWDDQANISARSLAFTNDMRAELARLCIAVVGLSGTGSIVAEQLLRLGVGRLIVIDHDKIEHKNLNRILNTTQHDAEQRRFKVDVFKEAAARINAETEVIPCPEKLGTLKSIELAAQADIVFSCVDTYSGRHIADRLAASMLQPLFDVGVVIPVRESKRGLVINNICGRIDYVQPCGSTLGDRKVYTPALLSAEYLREADPQAYADQVREGYMPGTQEQAPSVITVNMRAASTVVQELIARAYPYRINPIRNYARIEFDLVEEEHTAISEDEFSSNASPLLAMGLTAPLLGLPSLEDLRCGS